MQGDLRFSFTHSKTYLDHLSQSRGTCPSNRALRSQLAPGCRALRHASCYTQGWPLHFTEHGLHPTMKGGSFPARPAVWGVLLVQAHVKPRVTDTLGMSVANSRDPVGRTHSPREFSLDNESESQSAVQTLGTLRPRGQCCCSAETEPRARRMLGKHSPKVPGWTCAHRPQAALVDTTFLAATHE